MDFLSRLDDLEDDLDLLNDIHDLEILNEINKSYTIQPRTDQFNSWNETEFLKRYHLSKNTVLFILNKIGDQLRHRTEWNSNRAIQPIDQLLFTLRFLATGAFYTNIGDFGSIHKSTAAKIINRVITALCHLRPWYVNFPSTEEDKRSAMADFWKLARFPRVLGVIDCTHVKLESVGAQDAEAFRNRAGWYSLKVQIVSDANHKIVDIVCRWPGSVGKEHIFNCSVVKTRFDSGQIDGLLLGNGYSPKKYLLTPVRHPKEEAEKLYNECHLRTLNVGKSTISIWQRRFPILSLGLRCKLQLAQGIIVACAVLHNIACQQNETVFDDEDANEEDVKNDKGLQ